MSKSLVFGEDVLKKTFNDTKFAWLPLSGFYLSLHTDDPGASGGQSTNECNYGGYARVLIPQRTTVIGVLSAYINMQTTIRTRSLIIGKARTVIDYELARQEDELFLLTA